MLVCKHNNTNEKILWMLHSEPGLSRVELQTLLGLSQSTVCSALRRLLSFGFVRKEKDLRAKRTPKGRIVMVKCDIFSLTDFARGG